MVNSFLADQVYSLNKSNRGTYPLDQELVLIGKKEEEFRGPGMFFLYFKTQLVYIGSFLPRDKNRDVRNERVNKEIATISMRGARVSLNAAAINAKNNSKHLKNITSHQSGDFLSSKKRIEFADNHWGELKTNDFLSHFSFCWIKNNHNPRVTSKQLTAIKKELINFYKPLCNG